MTRKNGHLNKNEVGTVVPTSDGTHPSQKPRQSLLKSSAHSHGKHPKLNYRIPPVWFFIWNALMLINIIFGLLDPEHDILILFRVGSIALCLIYVAKIFPKDYLLLLAMFATCISDIILAFNNTSVIGLIIFLATQIIHLIRLDGQRLKNPILIFSILSATLITLDAIFDFAPLIILVAALYACVLTANFFASFRWHKSEPDNIRAAFAFAGFALFACCDLSIVFSYLSLINLLPTFVYIPANFFAWFFYYPSQILITNSGKLPDRKHSLSEVSP